MTQTAVINIILAALAAAGGAALGFFSSVLLERFRQRQVVVQRLLDQYFDVRREVVNVVSELTDLPGLQELSAETREGYRKMVSRVYFKHYDLLPFSVLEALLCLHACLIDGTGTFYQLQRYRDTSGREKAKIVAIKRGDEMALVRECCRYRNTELHAAHVLGGGSADGKQSLAIRIHAQNVLYRLNQFMTVEALLQMVDKLKKKQLP